MRVGLLLPGFSANEADWAIPVQQTLVRELSKVEEVRVISLRYPHTRTPYQIYTAQVYPLGAGSWARSLRRIWLWLDAFRLILRLHRECPFDVLHAMWADETGLIAAWAGKQLGIPSVVSIAGGELARLNDIGYGLQRSRFSRWIVGHALKADAVIAACSYASDLIAKNGYRVSQNQIHRISLGVDANLFQPAPHRSEKRRLIHAASLVPVKDQHTLLRAAARLDDVTLDLIGEGPEKPALQALAERLGISKRVQFVGNVPHQKMPAYYQQAALNLLSSRHEGLGMVTLEAAACGVPTITTAVGLLPDCPEMGVCVPVGDDLALAQAVEDLLENLPKRENLALSAREAVLAGYTIHHTVESLRRLYRSF